MLILDKNYVHGKIYAIKDYFKDQNKQFCSIEYDYEPKRTKRNKTCDRKNAPLERLRVFDSSKLDINGHVRTSPHVRTLPDLPYFTEIPNF